MSNPIREIGTASEIMDHPSIRAFIHDVTTNPILDIRTGYPSNDGEDYMTIPAHITTSTTTWGGQFALEIDVLHDENTDIITSMIGWLEEEMKNHDDYESGDE